MGCRIAAWLRLVPRWAGAASVPGGWARGEGVGDAGYMICVGKGDGVRGEGQWFGVGWGRGEGSGRLLLTVFNSFLISAIN